MEVEKIFFDMDGVLADFERGVRELCGIEPAPQGPQWKPGCDDAMWVGIQKVEHFYDRLEMIPGAKDLFASLHERYGDRIEILTGIPKPKRNIPDAGADKTNWVHRLLGEDIKVNIVLREQKPEYCRNKRCILIDDFGENIDAWEKCGGTGIRFRSAEETRKILEELGI